MYIPGAWSFWLLRTGQWRGLIPGQKNRFRARMIDRLIPKSGRGVEVGVWRAEFSRLLWRHAAPEALWLVDPYKTSERTGTLWSLPQADMDGIFREVRDWTAQVGLNGRRAHVLRETSLEAAERFPVGTLDWVYLDGDHSYEAVTSDITAWWPKLRPGGILFGDDWSTHNWYKDDVQAAVKTFANRERLNLEVVGGRPYQQWIIHKPL